MTKQKTRTILGVFSILILVTMPMMTTNKALATSYTGVIVPLYSYPGSYWDQLVEAKKAHPLVPIVAVINPDNGPGSQADQHYVESIKNLQSAGITVLGYVATGYGSRDADSAKSDIDIYHDWYNVDGIFFDEMSNSKGGESYYADLSAYAKSHGMNMTVGNPGVDTLSDYVGTMDNLVIYEDQGLPTMANLGGWHTSYAKSNFSMIAFGVGLPSQTYVTAASKYVNYVYFTNDRLDNPYDTVPPYIADLVAELDSTITPTLPDAPTGLVASTTSQSQIDLHWHAPSNDGGSMVTGYRILRSSDDGATWSVVVQNTANAKTAYSDTGLVTNATYAYHVSALNLLGPSPPSNTVSAKATNPVQITVKTVNASGSAIAGMWTTLSDGKHTKSGYSTIRYSVAAGSTYTVTVANYKHHVFDHWSDGSTNSTRRISPMESITLVAYYVR